MENIILITENVKAEARRLGGEAQAIIRITSHGLTYREQLDALSEAIGRLHSERLSGMSPVFVRFFLSDAANQAEQLSAITEQYFHCAVSIVCQPPLDGTKVAAWVIYQKGEEPELLPCGLYQKKGAGVRQLWGAMGAETGAGSYVQTVDLMQRYVAQLRSEGLSLKENCQRTWFFVQNIDTDYNGMVKARNDIFATEGLSKDSHFIASTGIGGGNADPKVLVAMDSYAVAGLPKDSVRYLRATTHLNPTYEYGVSFERGTSIDFGDHREVLISGTASINNRGEIVHPGDIARQTERMWENVEALLREADCGYGDVMAMIVYLRDIADYNTVSELYEKRFPDTPKVFTMAKVCRPGWLIEMECMACRISS